MNEVNGRGHLSNSIKNTVNVMDGYTTGTLFVDEYYVGLLLEGGSKLHLYGSQHIEVRNDDESYESDVRIWVKSAIKNPFVIPDISFPSSVIILS